MGDMPLGQFIGSVILARQGGDYAEGIKKTLADKITLPAGFEIDLYAIVPDARSMAHAKTRSGQSRTATKTAWRMR